MAGIDKTYVTLEQYKEVKKFFTKEIQEKQKNDIGYYFGYASYKDKDFKEYNERVLWNTGTLVDMWLASYCKLDFIQERLHQQYSDDWIGWLPNINFNEKGYIYHISNDKSSLNLYTKISDDKYLVADKIVVYGTSYFFKIYHEACSAVRGERYNIDNNITVDFNLFGLDFTYGNKKYYYNGKECYIGYFPVQHLFKDEKDKFEKFIPTLPIKHSYSKKDLKKYSSCEIVLSCDNECFTMNMFNDIEESNLFHLPKYIFERIS